MRRLRRMKKTAARRRKSARTHELESDGFACRDVTARSADVLECNGNFLLVAAGHTVCEDVYSELAI